jgi:acyl-coenzyme A synthetase/AMP-(fatty) acid ligase
VIVSHPEIVGVVSKNSISYVQTLFECYQNQQIVVLLRRADDSRIRQTGVTRVVEPDDAKGWFKEVYVFPRGDALAQIAFTSGTEGEPKGVLLTHRAFADVTERLNKVMEVDSRIREYVGVPANFSFGLGRFRAVAAAGGASFLPPHGFDPLEIRELLKAGEINAVSAVPSLWRILLANERIFGSEAADLKWIEIGSQYMSRGEKEQLKALFPNAIIVQHYGLTEASRTTFLRIDQTEGEALESVGRAYGQTEVRISHTGRICIRGPHVARQLLKDGEYAPNVDAEGWLQTSDLGHLEEGYLYYDGRADDLINCGGIKLSPEALERELRALLNLSDGLAVAAVPDPLTGHGVLIATLRHQEPDEAALLDGTSELLLTCGINNRRVIKRLTLDTFPVTDTNKVRRKALAQQYKEQEARKPTPPAEPSAPRATSIRAEIGHIFGRKVGPQDSFISLGGDSLSFIQASLIIEERLGFLPDDWERLPISQLERMQQTPSTASADSDVGSSMRSEIVLRAVAILGVVITHADLYFMPGGAFVLIVFAGYAFARFQRDRLWSGRVFQAFTPFLLRILVPYYLVLAAYAVARGGIEPQHWFLIANFYPEIQLGTGLLPFYWFIDNLTQIVILFSLLFLVHPLRRILRDRPFGAGLTLLGISFAVSIATPAALRGADLAMLEAGWFFVRTPMFTFYMFVFGWCLFFASEKWQRFLLTGAALITFSTVQIGSYSIWLIAGALIAIWAPSIVVIPPVRKIASVIASSSFYIFIAHMIPIYLALFVIGIDNAYAKFAVVLIAISLGIIMAAVVRRGEAMMRRAFEKLQQTQQRSRNP